MTLAEVHLYETLIGAVTWDHAREIGVFEYDPAFLHSDIEIYPIHLLLQTGFFSFPGLRRGTWRMGRLPTSSTRPIAAAREPTAIR